MAQRDFTEGSVLRHILVMSSTSTIGLLAMFGVDLTDLIFLSHLGDHNIIAAMGFAGVLLFFTQSIGIGLSIAMLSIVSRKLGTKDREAARSSAINILLLSVMIAISIVIALYPWLKSLMHYLGATETVALLALDYLKYVFPAFPLLVLASCSNALVRAIGDARRAMIMMLMGAAVNIILDPILIFGFNMGIEGAALASLCARITMAGFALYAASVVHDMFATLKWRAFVSEYRSILTFAIPTTLTNFATPVGMALVTYKMAEIGTEAVAGSAIISRITPVAFAVFYSLSGAVGPIIGQNFGAQHYHRVTQTLSASLRFSCAYTVILWVILVLTTPLLLQLFAAQGGVAEIVRSFNYYAIPMTCAMGALFVANAAFNNMGKPILATVSNFARNTIGVVPFIWIGGAYFGGEGVIVGYALGGCVCGFASYFFARAMARRQQTRTSGDVHS